MPQGFTEAPSSFSRVPNQDLSTFQFPRKSTLLQYVDHLLLCLVTKEVSMKDSIYLLHQLAEKRHKVSKERLQLSLDTVHYLRHNPSTEGTQLFPKMVKLIQEFPRPTAK